MILAALLGLVELSSSAAAFHWRKRLAHLLRENVVGPRHGWKAMGMNEERFVVLVAAMLAVFGIFSLGSALAG